MDNLLLDNLGMVNYQHSLLHYTWTSRTIEQWNNDYYRFESFSFIELNVTFYVPRILALEDMYIHNVYKKNLKEDNPIVPITPVGDAFGNKAKTAWRARARS